MTAITPASRSRRPSKLRRLQPGLRNLMPYLIRIGGFLIAWQILSLILGVARLPGPINVIVDTWDPYISQPFFDDGGTSKGLGWQILISLQRVPGSRWWSWEKAGQTVPREGCVHGAGSGKGSR